MAGPVPVAVDDAAWAVQEFGDAALGDQRRTDCLIRIATAVGAAPQASLPQACGDPALLKASGNIVDGNCAKRWHQPLRQAADAARLYRAGG